MKWHAYTDHTWVKSLLRLRNLYHCSNVFCLQGCPVVVDFPLSFPLWNLSAMVRQGPQNITRERGWRRPRKQYLGEVNEVLQHFVFVSLLLLEFWILTRQRCGSYHLWVVEHGTMAPQKNRCSSMALKWSHLKSANSLGIFGKSVSTPRDHTEWGSQGDLDIQGGELCVTGWWQEALYKTI